MRTRWLLPVVVGVFGLIAAAGAPSPSPPTPLLSADAEVGSTLTVSNGGWLFEPQSLSYRWESCTSPNVGCVDVGTNASSYLVDAIDVDRFVRATVTAVNAAGQASSISNSVGPVTSPAGASVVQIAGGSSPEQPP